jgi:hypothetical protein
MRLFFHARIVCLIGLIWICAEPARAAKLTGWFACQKCTAPRVANGDLRPSNPHCAKQCIEKGSAAVFINEQGKELLRVTNSVSVEENLGYHVEVTGDIDSESKTIAIEAVKRLGDSGASCSRPLNRTRNSAARTVDPR